MDRDTDRYRNLTRRTLLLGGAKLGLLSTLVARMYYLQVVDSGRYQVLADENRINLRLIAPSRGQILDRSGVSLAINNQNFRVIVTAEQAVRKLEETLDKLSGIVPLTEADIRRILREVQRKRAFVPVTIKENLTWDQVATVEVNTPDLPGVSIDVGEIRSYPFSEAAAHVLGYVGAVAESELTGDPVLSLPGFRIGKNGVEKAQEAVLRGTAGTFQAEVNSVGRVIRELGREEGHAGREVTLTIDIGLQQYVQQRLGDQLSAAAVVMDVHTGGVYALASNPSFDPNNFTMGINAELWEELLSTPTAPLTNKVIAGQYPPGSTFKMMVAMAALESGAITPHHTVFCPGYMELGDHSFHCWKKGGHGTMDVVNGFAHSCDVFFFDVGHRVGIDKIAAMCRRFGIGERLGLDLPGERPGLVPTREWKLAHTGVSWQPGETLVAAIGQGYVLATPLQLVTMTARLVNGGYAVVPHLTKAIEGGEPERTSWPTIGIQRSNLELVVKGMVAVGRPGGTAYSVQIPDPSMEFGGKTGTAQVRRIGTAERNNGVRNNLDLPWRERDHALFVGFAPVSAPRYACAVIVEHGGDHTATPIARDILWECQKRDIARVMFGGPSADAGPAAEPPAIGIITTAAGSSPRKKGG
ncbi:MAG: penicillin-binding protein 2 [Azospirillaceae bacterium]|nr:penicillin-binding protein 2 [Azospirillaceae bacterium]